MMNNTGLSSVNAAAAAAAARPEDLWARPPLPQQNQSAKATELEFQQLEIDDYEVNDEAVIRMFGATRVSK